MIEVSETRGVFFGREMQRFIEEECKKPHKQWIYEIIDGRREQQSILYQDPESRFLILPSTSDLRRRPRGYIGIFTDKTLRTIRDLRKKHIDLIVDACNAAAKILPRSFSHASFHYHPSVYQLHIHFREHKDIEVGNTRVYPVQFVLLCLSIESTFFYNSTLKYKINPDSNVVKIVNSTEEGPNGDAAEDPCTDPRHRSGVRD